MKKTDFDKLHVGHRIYTDKEHLTECIEKIKDKGFGYSLHTDVMGSYVTVEEADYDCTKAKAGEIEAWGMIYAVSPFLANKTAKELKELDGVLGVSPMPNGIVVIFATENDMKAGYNLLHHKGRKVRKVGKCFIPNMEDPGNEQN